VEKVGKGDVCIWQVLVLLFGSTVDGKHSNLVYAHMKDRSNESTVGRAVRKRQT
jgi:hypothetical protein